MHCFYQSTAATKHRTKVPPMQMSYFSTTWFPCSFFSCVILFCNLINLQLKFATFTMKSLVTVWSICSIDSFQIPFVLACVFPLPPVCSVSKWVHYFFPVFWSGKMERHEKIAALKPQVSRPFSSFMSSQKLLQDFTATGSPPITVLDEAVLIRPKVTRFPSLPSDIPTEITSTIVSLTLEFGLYFSTFTKKHVSDNNKISHADASN